MIIMAGMMTAMAGIMMVMAGITIVMAGIMIVMAHIMMICHSLFSDSSPAYLSSLTISLCTFSRQLCSSVDTQILLTPNVKSKTLWPTLFLFLRHLCVHACV